MYVTTRTEVRTVTPLYIENDRRLIVSFNHGGGRVTTAKRVKIVRLTSGKFSVRGIGKGKAFPTTHMLGTTRFAMAGEGEQTLAEFWHLYGPESSINLTVQTP